MDSLRAYGVLAVALLGAAYLTPRAFAGGTSTPALVVTNTADSGMGSLRQAILDANSTSGADNITFNIPGSGVHQIQPLTALPYLDEAVTIDGSTQTGFSGTPLIEIDGTLVQDDSGLVIRTNSCKLRSLAIGGFGHDGVTVTGESTYATVIENCFIGTDASGTVARGNGASEGEQFGVRFTSNSGGNTIQDSLVSGNFDGGITIEDGAAYSTISNCKVGTDVTGTLRLPNNQQGILLQSGAHDLIVQDNLVSGNNGHGIHLKDASVNFVSGNIVGANAAGTDALENQGVGVYLTTTGRGTSGNYVGGEFTGSGNLLSGNVRDGVRIEGTGVSGTIIQGNRIGTDVTGTGIIGNGDGGVAIINSSGHKIGGPGGGSARIGSRKRSSAIHVSAIPDVGLGVANLLSGNADDGVFISGVSSTENMVQENLIGTDVAGATALPNGATGVTLRNASSTLITLNKIAGNAVAGIRLQDSAYSNTITENYVGTNYTGTARVGGNGPGILIETNSYGNSVRQNLVSGNGGDGISLLSGALNNSLRNNSIGVDRFQEAAIANTGHGIRVEGSGTEIGAFSGEGNVVSGNGQSGIYFAGAGATDNKVVGNRIGTNGAGDTALPNGGHGVFIGGNATRNTVGASSFTSNVIAYNTLTGVSVTSGVGNTIRGNAIHHNGRLGIDLNEDAITYNDFRDFDLGPNTLQNFPVLTAVNVVSGSTSISGTLDTTPNQTYDLDFYNNTDLDPTGHGEGQVYLTSTTVTTDSAGHAAFTATTSTAIDSGSGVSATATDPSGNTSEFSANFGLNADLTPPIITACYPSPYYVRGVGGTVDIIAEAYDNTSVEMVRATVTAPDGTTTLVPMLPQGSAGYFSGTFDAPRNPFSSPQEYTVKIEAFDAAGNRAAANCDPFTVDVVDATPPEITDCNVSPRALPNTGGTITFSANFYDADEVREPQAVITRPDSTEIIVPLSPQGESSYAGGTYTLPANLGTSEAVYGIRFEAKDGSGNRAVEPCGTVTVAAPDTTGPAIVNCQVNPRALPAAGGIVTISADITDPTGVYTVTAVITLPDGSMTNVVLLRQGMSDTFQGTFNAPANTSAGTRTYGVRIAANDFRGNASLMDCGTFTVGSADTTQPEILDCQLTPAVLPPAGGTVTIEADVTDNSGVRSVLARISRPNGTIATVPLTLESGNHYTGTFAAPANTGPSDQTYTVFTVATDQANNTTVLRCGTFLVQAPDTQQPNIQSCQVSPRRLPAPGGDFTITATVSDNRAVASVVAQVTGPSGTTAVTLTSRGSNIYRDTFSAPANLSAQDVNYAITLVATDTTGNQSTMDCGTATVLKPDNELPVIVSCDVLPRTLLASGGAVTLRANVTDNAGVDRVEAIITDSQSVSITMFVPLQSGTTYEGTWVAPANAGQTPQSYQVTFRAVDTSGNEVTADCGAVTVNAPDNQSPVITACQVTPRALLASGGTVTITATVTDDVAVSAVRARITRPDSTQTLVTLTAQGGNNYQGSFAAPANTGGNPQTYQVEIQATDNSSNQSTADCGSFTVAIPDPTAPVLVNCNVTPRALPASGGMVTITADATDNVSVQSVIAEIQRPDGTTTAVQLTSTGGSGYQGTFTLPANDTNATRTYLVRLVATDPTGNRTTEDCGAVTVSATDRVAPVITNCAVNPNTLPFSGGAVNVIAVVTDNSGVASVVARITRGGSLIDTVALTPGALSSYAVTFGALMNRTAAPQEYMVELVATDTSGNARTVECGTYTVQTDTVPPSILSCDATPRSLGSEGGLVTFTATVTDSIPLSRVVAVVTLPDGNPRRVVLEAVGQDQYRGTWTLPVNNSPIGQIYNVTLEAADLAGNVATADCGQLTVALASGGSAQVSVNKIPFGRVRRGTRVRRQFVIRNVAGGSPLAVSLSTLELPFSVRLEGSGLNSTSAKKGKGTPEAAPGTASSFSIRPGGIVTVFVEFAPTTIRNFSDRLLITTSDPRHPEFRVRITGVGCKNGRSGTPIGDDGGAQAQSGKH